MCTRPFDGNMWCSFIYSFICARPLDQDLGSWLISLIFIRSFYRPKIRVHTWFISFICTRPFSENIWSSFIYCFFCVKPFDQNLRSSLIYFFIWTWPFDQSWGYSCSLIYSFLDCANISLAMLPLSTAFVRYIHTLIFCTLYWWMCCIDALYWWMVIPHKQNLLQPTTKTKETAPLWPKLILSIGKVSGKYSDVKALIMN